MTYRESNSEIFDESIHKDTWSHQRFRVSTNKRYFSKKMLHNRIFSFFNFSDFSSPYRSQYFEFPKRVEIQQTTSILTEYTLPCETTAWKVWQWSFFTFLHLQVVVQSYVVSQNEANFFQAWLKTSKIETRLVLHRSLPFPPPFSCYNCIYIYRHYDNRRRCWLCFCFVYSFVDLKTRFT